MISGVGPALVLKLGGSLAESHRLTGLLEAVVRATAPVVIVPGGGPFADAVRAIQPRLQLTDALAHRLALLSMHQMGHVIAARHPRFVTAETLPDIAQALVTGAIPVWLPFALQHDDATLPADWTATSDTMAARLAGRMGSGSVALVKSCAVTEGATLTGLTADGIIDPVFAEAVTRDRLSWRVYGTGDEAALAARLGASSQA